MKKLALLTIILIGILSCSSLKNIPDGGKGVGIKQKTANPNTPYIYRYGYKDFEIVPTLMLSGETLHVNELRFNAPYSSFYTSEVMFNRFGEWDKVIQLKNEESPNLVWENRQLFKSQKELYSVVTNGTETIEEMFTSVIVFDSNNIDCLTEISVEKDSIINFFSKGIINLGADDGFYDAYWSMWKDRNKKE